MNLSLSTGAPEYPAVYTTGTESIRMFRLAENSWEFYHNLTD